jgi:SAM-dependent methyltransferase
MHIAVPGSTQTFDARHYWARRLTDGAQLAATGTRPFGEDYQLWLYRLKEAAVRRAISQCRGDVSGADVLNVGCGWGYFEPLFAQWGAAQVTGIDFVESTVQALKARGGPFEYHTGDIGGALPAALTGRTFDVVTAIDVLYHLVDERAFVRAVRNLCSLCRPDGGMLVWTDAPWRATRQDEQHPHCRYRNWSRYQAIFEEFGLTRLAATPMYHLFDVYQPWMEHLARHPSIAYPLMYAFDRVTARFGWRRTTNYCAVAVRA